MRSFLKGKKGLSTVVTTLIILVVSVLLATVVTYYAINMTTTRVQEENLRISKGHIWANASVQQAAFVNEGIPTADVHNDKRGLLYAGIRPYVSLRYSQVFFLYSGCGHVYGVVCDDRG